MGLRIKEPDDIGLLGKDVPDRRWLGAQVTVEKLAIGAEDDTIRRRMGCDRGFKVQAAEVADNWREDGEVGRST